MTAFLWFALGFACAAALAVGWHLGKVKPRMDALAKMAEDHIKRGVETVRGKFGG